MDLSSEASALLLLCAARMILNKAGVRLHCWCLPDGLPQPVMLIGVGIYNPPVLHGEKARYTRAPPTAAAVVTEIRGGSVRDADFVICSNYSCHSPEDFYNLETLIEKTVYAAAKHSDIIPCAVIVWLGNGV
jgi:hypothetical protein